MTEKLIQGTNYVAARTTEVKDVLTNNYPEIKSTVQASLTEGSQLLSQKWDHVYQTTMYIPKKAIQVTGEVYISAQEIVFAYGKVGSTFYSYKRFAKWVLLFIHTKDLLGGFCFLDSRLC